MARGSEERRQRVGDMRRPNDVEQCCDVNTRETSEQAEEAMSEAQLAQQANLALPLTHLGKMHEEMLSQKSQPQDTSTTTAVPPQIPPETCQGANRRGWTGSGFSWLIYSDSTLIDFLHSVPIPLATLLVRLAPIVSYIRHVAQMVNWRSSWVDSWLLLASCWALVLFVDPLHR